MADCFAPALAPPLLVEAIKTKYLPKDPELETLDETYSTWHIRDWRRLHKKEYSPTFDCGDGKW